MTKLTCHTIDCTWATPLPTGYGFWGCSCGFAEQEFEKNYFGVHATHCCKNCGCVYNDDDCPVVLGKVKGLDNCESCQFRMEELEALVDELTDEERIKLFSKYCRCCGSDKLPCFCTHDE
jgi:hypothetical protein